MHLEDLFLRFVRIDYRDNTPANASTQVENTIAS